MTHVVGFLLTIFWCETDKERSKERGGGELCHGYTMLCKDMNSYAKCFEFPPGKQLGIWRGEGFMFPISNWVTHFDREEWIINNNNYI